MTYNGKKKYNKKNKSKSKSKQTLTTRGGRNRRAIARVIRPITLRPEAAIQKVVYVNTFECRPGLNGSNAQQNFSFQLILNSPWLFGYNWDSRASGTNQLLKPNEPIIGMDPSTGKPTATTTIMPGTREGGGVPFNKYQQGYVTGTKVNVVATPLNNEAGKPIQLAYLYAHTSSTGNSLDLTDNMTTLSKRPYVKMKKLMGQQIAALQQASNNVSSSLVIKHSPKRWNNIKDIRDNKQLSFSTQANTYGEQPDELDFLTIGCMPALNNYVVPGASGETQATNFQLQLRVEQSILWTEPLDNKGTFNANLAYPVPTNNYRKGFLTMAAASAGAAFMGY